MTLELVRQRLAAHSAHAGGELPTMKTYCVALDLHEPDLIGE